MDSQSSHSDDFEIIDLQEASLEPDDITKIQSWLQPTNYNAESSEYHRHVSSQAPDTGLWICDTDQYRQWFESPRHGSLWIKGVPGSGKSVLAASVAQHLKKEGTFPVLSFFFRQIIATNRNHRSLCQDWLAQLLPSSTVLQALIQLHLDGELADVSNDQLWEWLLAGLSSVPRVYCIVDAMDEMDESGRSFFLKQLDHLGAYRPDSIKVFLTSRPHQYLQSGLWNSSIVHISLEQDLVGKDIRCFVTYRLKGVIGEESAYSLCDIICERAGGLFLYARLMIDQLIPNLHSKQNMDIHELANTLPIGLEDMYNSILHNQQSESGISNEIQLTLLEAVTHSAKPLRLTEISSLLTCEFPATDLPDAPKAIARSACGPLIEILEDETVQVIHHSFTEFLLDTERKSRLGDIEQFPIIHTSITHGRLATRCLRYLQSGVMSFAEATANVKLYEEESEDKGQQSGYQAARLQHPFLQYSLDFWVYHASRYDVEDETFFSSLDDFLDPSNRDFQSWTKQVWGWGVTLSDEKSNGIVTPLHIASFAGLTRYAFKLLERGESVHSLDAVERTPLHWAARNGNTAMVIMLLDNGADSDPHDIRGNTPLHEAARKNHAFTVERLLEVGVDPLTSKTRENHSGMLLGGEGSTKGETALDYVCRHGHTETLIIMIPHLGRDEIEKALCLTCAYSRTEAVRAILESTEVSANATLLGETALYLAVTARNPDCVKLLLARGADVQVKSHRKIGRRYLSHRGDRSMGTAMTPKTALQGLVSFESKGDQSSFEPILRNLLDAGADLNEKDERGRTLMHLLLFCLSHTSHHAECRYLLQAGGHALLEVYDDAGDTPLHEFLRRSQNLTLLQHLFEFGADIDSRGISGDSLLHAALSCPNSSLNRSVGSTDDVVRFLLQKGARSETQNDLGTTTLELAVQSCSLEVLKTLLGDCADVATRARCLFHHNSCWSYPEMMEYIELLKSAGVCLETRNGAGRTALLENIGSQGRYFDALEESGARLDAKDNSGQGIMHIVCSRYDFARTKLDHFLEIGLDPYVLDSQNNSLLHEVSRRYDGHMYIDVVRKLLGLGLSVNAQNLAGETPLHLSVQRTRLGSTGLFGIYTPLLTLFRESGQNLDLETRDKNGMTALHMACLRSEELVSELLKDGANSAIVTKDKRSVLHLACRARKANIVGLLLQEIDKEMIDKPDSFLRTPLHDACTSGRQESVYYLLKAGASVDLKDMQGRNPLHSCAEFEVEQMRWTVLKDGRSHPGQSCEDALRPLGQGSYYQEPWYSCKWKMEPNFEDEYHTPSPAGIVSMLITYGADTAAIDNEKHDPLDLALWYGCKRMIRSLLNSKMYDGIAEAGSSSSMRLVEASLIARSTSIGSLDASIVTELLNCPRKYIKHLDADDLEHLDKKGVDMSQPVQNLEFPSILNFVAHEGLIDRMEKIGHHAKKFDDLEWTMEWTRKACADSVRQPSYFAPPLHVCCERPTSNMMMLELLVDRFGVDVNERALVHAPADFHDYQLGPSALHCLAHGRYWWQMDAIKYLVSKGADVNALNQKGETALHIASTIIMGEGQNFWKFECVKVLLDLGANPNITDASGASCLSRANTQTDVLKELLRRGADPLLGGVPPLFTAIHAANVSAVTLLLDHGASPNSKDATKQCEVSFNVKDQARYALLCAACPLFLSTTAKDFVPVVKLLIERGADMYSQLNEKDVLLYYLFEHSEYEILMEVLDHLERTDLNARDPRGRTVFLASCDWIEALPGYQHKPRVPKEMSPALKILENGADITVSDYEGRHALHHLLDTLESEDDTILQIMERDDCKSLIILKDNKGYSPLHRALHSLRPQVCEALIALGAHLLEPDPEGMTALHHMAPQCLKKYVSIRRFTARRDLPPDYKDQCYRLWQKYLTMGGDIDARDNAGNPPLFNFLSDPMLDDEYQSYAYAEGSPHVDHFEELFANANVHARNLKGETALHTVAGRKEGSGYDLSRCQARDRQLFEFLISRGVDPLHENNAGQSALDVAAACEKKAILALFQYRQK
ncbi:ankyrin [Lophium mytilinum]|uniref:Ankyrin n=1 Tax=Lophium mytilinum TaxID=390894 RepID=A0A6A6QQS3_9PEZI|nr:ankyrin [Lophium mytilinum]